MVLSKNDIAIWHNGELTKPVRVEIILEYPRPHWDIVLVKLLEDAVDKNTGNILKPGLEKLAERKNLRPDKEFKVKEILSGWRQYRIDSAPC